MVKELFLLAREAQKEDHALPWFRAQQWYFFGVATFYLYLRWVGVGGGARGAGGTRHQGRRSNGVATF